MLPVEIFNINSAYNYKIYFYLNLSSYSWKGAKNLKVLFIY